MLGKLKKKMPVLLAACVLTALLAPSSFAAAPGNTITVIDTNQNHEYTAYQLFTGTADSKVTTLSNIHWGEDVDSAGLLNAIAEANGSSDSPLYGKFSGISSETTAAELGLMLQELSNEEARVFAGIVSKHLTGEGYSGSFRSGSYSIGVPCDGYYLVADSLKEGSAQEMYSGYIARVVKNTTVSPKISVPTIEKQVYDYDSDTWTKGADQSIGENIVFKVTITLPDNFNDYEKYTCIVRDQLSEGLTFRTVQECTIDGRAILSKNYNVSIDNNLLTIDIDAKAAGGTDGSVIVVQYMAQLNNKAVAGTAENNAVTLTYSNNPTNSSDTTMTNDTPDDVVHLYTYRLDISKVIKGTDNALPGAGFVLSRKNGNSTEYAKVSNGKMTDWTGNEYEATILESIADGSITLDGLGDGTYQLTEVKAPDGYDLLEEPITIVLDGKQDADGMMESLTCTANGLGLKEGSVTADTNAGAAGMTVENTKGSLLPSTGGAGTLSYFAAGILLMAAAGSVPLIRRRRRAEG